MSNPNKPYSTDPNAPNYAPPGDPRWTDGGLTPPYSTDVNAPNYVPPGDPRWTNPTDPHYPGGTDPRDPNFRGDHRNDPSNPNYRGNPNDPNYRAGSPGERNLNLNDPSFRGNVNDPNYRAGDPNYRGNPNDPNYSGRYPAGDASAQNAPGFPYSGGDPRYPNTPDDQRRDGVRGGQRYSRDPGHPNFLDHNDPRWGGAPYAGVGGLGYPTDPRNPGDPVDNQPLGHANVNLIVDGNFTLAEAQALIDSFGGSGHITGGTFTTAKGVPHVLVGSPAGAPALSAPTGPVGDPDRARLHAMAHAHNEREAKAAYARNVSARGSNRAGR